jgi:hypothetical protein
MHLTDLKIRAFPFEDGQRDYTDHAMGGLSVRVGKRGKTFMPVIGELADAERLQGAECPPG